MLRRLWIGSLLGITLFLVGLVQPSSGSVPPVQELTDENGIDLSEALWWCIQEPTPGSQDKEKRWRISLPLKKPLVLQGASVWLVCNISVAPYDSPASRFYGTEVIIGNIAGNDQTYWNQTQIGETTGRSLSETGRFRRYRPSQG